MVNMHARRDQVLPMRDAILVNDEVKRIGPGPGFQDEMLVEVFAPGRFATIEEIGLLVHEKEFSVQVKGQRAAVME